MDRDEQLAIDLGWYATYYDSARAGRARRTASSHTPRGHETLKRTLLLFLVAFLVLLAAGGIGYYVGKHYLTAPPGDQGTTVISETAPPS